MGFKNNDQALFDTEEQLKSKKIELEKLVSTVSEYEKMVKSQTLKAKDLENVNIEIEKAKENLANVNSEISKKEAAFRGQGKMNQSDIDNYQAQLEALRKEEKEVTKSLDVAKKELAPMETRKGEVSDKISLLEKELSESKTKLTKEINSLTFQKEEEIEKLSVVQNDLSVSAKRLKESKAELDKINKLRAGMDNLEENFKKVLAQKLEAEKELFALTDKLEKSKDEVLKMTDDFTKKVEQKNQELVERESVLSVREQKLEETKRYIEQVLPRLANIDAKAISKIDLSKI